MFRKRRAEAGSRPGTLVIDPESPATRINVLAYGPDAVDVLQDPKVGELNQIIASHKVTWVDVQGFGSEPLLRELARQFDIHDLALEDVVHVPQRPKAEPYESHLFLIARMVHPRVPFEPLDTEQISIFLGPGYVLSFQNRYGDVLDPVRQRIHTGTGPIRQQGPDYLTYALLDTVIDHYYPVLESFGEELSDLEDEALSSPHKSTLRAVNRIRRDLLMLRRILWPERDAIWSMIRDEDQRISKPVRTYLRDIHDHCHQITDVVDSYRETVNSVTNTYLTMMSNRTNDVMKLLTIMASIFIPLTFIAGIYGMNFEDMPELHSRYGYPIVGAVMLAVAAGMVTYFYRKGWIGRDGEE